MQWIVETPDPAPAPIRVLRRDNIRLSISATASGRTCQHVGVSLAVLSDDSPECCEATWPRKAIALLRAQADALEAELDTDDRHSAA